jgi:HNH endonuclease
MQRIMVACEACGREFLVAPTERARGRGRFCSPSCWHANRPTRPASDRFWSHVAKGTEAECWLWTAGRTPSGYGTFMVRHGHRVPAHRFSYELVHGTIPDGMFCCHACDVPACCNPQHLFAATHADNMADMVAKGRQTSGERNARAKLTAAAVEAIRRRIADGTETQARLAVEYGVDPSLISHLARGRRWRHLHEVAPM